jgi:recombination protein RecA
MARPATVKSAASDDARAKQLQDFIKKANKAEPGAMFTFVGQSLDVPAISTGALSLDFALGVGGLPKGRVVEIYGPESAGKTSLALSVCSQAIKEGGLAALVDVEHAVNPEHVKGMGVDLDYFAITQPDSGEEALKKVDEMLDSGLFSVIVIDSLAALQPKVILEGEIGDVTVGAQARLMSQTLPRLVTKASNTGTIIIFINQLRSQIGSYGNPENTPGGRALKYYASVRIEVRSSAGNRIMAKGSKDTQIGMTCNARVVKLKVAPPQKRAEYNIIFGKGIDFASSVFEVAVALGVLTADSGNAYTLALTGEVLVGDDGKVVRGRDNIKNLLSTRPELAQLVTQQCYAAMKSGRDLPEGVTDPLPDEAFADAEAAEVA